MASLSSPSTPQTAYPRRSQDDSASSRALAAVPLAGLLGHAKPSPQCEGAATFLAGSARPRGRLCGRAESRRGESRPAPRGARRARARPRRRRRRRRRRARLAPMPLAMLRNALRSQVIEDRVQFDARDSRYNSSKRCGCGTQLGARVATPGYERADEPLALGVDRVRARGERPPTLRSRGPRPARRRRSSAAAPPPRGRPRRRRRGAGRRRRRARALARGRGEAAAPAPAPCSR